MAVGAGTVFYVGDDMEILFGTKPDFYGRLVVAEMADQREGQASYALYGHLESVSVPAGQSVKGGDWLLTVDATGMVASLRDKTSPYRAVLAKSAGLSALADGAPFPAAAFAAGAGARSSDRNRDA